LTISYCTFINNRYTDFSSSGGGGALYGGSAYVTNSLFVGNTGAKQGGAIWTTGSTNGETGLGYGVMTFGNCTFAKNQAPQGGAIYRGIAALNLVNCIVWDNDVGGIFPNTATAGIGPVTIINNILQEAAPQPETWGTVTGNLVADPRFLAPSLGNYRLRPDSPAIDAGVNSATGRGNNWYLQTIDITAPDTDLDGHSRPVGAAVDMGAYEFDTETYHDPFDVNQDGMINALDVQLVINWALSLPANGDCDINDDGVVNAVDIQYIINGALGIR